MDEIAQMIKKEKDISDALDREHRAIWHELTKCHITKTSDYTTELLDKQIKSLDEENYTRCSSLSLAQNSMKNVLKKTSTMYDTANYGVHMLTDTLCHTEGEVRTFCDRIKATKQKREEALAKKLNRVTMQKRALDELGENVLLMNQHSSGMDKLSALISNLKIAEDASFTALEESFEGTTLHLKNKESTGDDLRRSVGNLEAQSRELCQVLEKEEAFLRLQQVKITKNHDELEELHSRNSEQLKTVVDEQKNLKRLCDCYSSTDTQLSVVSAETKSVCEKLLSLSADVTSMEAELALNKSAWQDEFDAKKKTFSQKLLELEQQLTNEQEEYTRLNCQLENLKRRFNSSDDMSKWDEVCWNRVLQEKSELYACLETETKNLLDDVAAIEKEIADLDQEDSLSYSTVDLERDFVFYMETKNQERNSMYAKLMDANRKLDIARENVARLEAIHFEKEGELSKLFGEMKDIQAQIEAFTTLSTPCKPVGVPTEVNTRKSLTLEQRRSSKLNDPDSDDGSSSCVRDVVGLQPFSPETVSFKQRAKSRKVVSQKEFKSKSFDFVQNGGDVTTTEQRIQALNPTTKPVSSSQYHESAHHYFSVENVDSLFSTPNHSQSDRTPPDEVLVAKRFPNDIFLNTSSSVGKNESASAEVSSFFETYPDQSMWSAEQPYDQNDTLNMTTETDLDQSVW